MLPAYGGKAADAEAPGRRRDLDDLEGVLELLAAVPLPAAVPAVPVLPAHHRETRLVVREGGGGDHGHGGLLAQA